MLPTVPMLSVRPTPLEPMDRLAMAIGLPTGVLWVKRDDLTGLGGGGNKARKLEFLCADALAQGCDVLVTGGGRQSNHVRLTAAAANRLGLACTAVLTSERPAVASGNVVLAELFGAELIWAGPSDYYGAERAIADTAERLRRAGRRPYAIPVGGASDVGALGYVDAARELETQLPDLSLVIVADGSGGSHAGLVAGLGDHDRVLGIDVGTRPDLDQRVPEKAAAAAALVGRPAPVGRVRIDHTRFGSGYGATTPETLSALRLVARTEGLPLDPVYTGKAMVGLLAAVAEGVIGPHDRVVFVHTGGLPTLFARSYAAWLTGGERTED